MDHNTAMLEPLAAEPVPLASTERRGIRPRDLAKELRLSPNMIYRAINSGELPAWRFGRSVVVPAAAVDDWLASKIA